MLAGHGMGMAVTRKENSHSNIGNNQNSGKSVNSGSGIFATVTGSILFSSFYDKFSFLLYFLLYYVGYGQLTGSNACHTKQETFYSAPVILSQ